MFIQYLILIIGLGLLWGGAELLIRYSSIIAHSLGVSPMIIGLTIVSIGTSLPEFVVSLVAAVQNTMGISLGNIIGSNIANIGLILGIGAVLSTLPVKKEWVSKEVPIMLFFTVVFTIFARTGYDLNRIEGAVLLIFLITFLAYLSHTSLIQMQEHSLSNSAQKLQSKQKLEYILLTGAGIVLMIIGSKLTVNSGTLIAENLGVSDTVIGLTLIAVGTSLPELATTIVGIIKKETDIVVGNVIGSNIFNLLFIGGAVSVIRPIRVPHGMFHVDFIFLLGISLIVWPIMRFRWSIGKIEGFILLFLYALFITITFLE
ncbi:MAG: calcium/sodium antiporter [Calditrichota bacterium]|jgi:cation:H+ antiporter